MDGDSPDVVREDLALPDMHADAELDAKASNAVAHRHRSPDRGAGAPEGRQEPTPRGVHLPAPEAIELRSHEAVVLGKHLLPARIPEPARGPGRVDDVG